MLPVILLIFSLACSEVMLTFFEAGAFRFCMQNARRQHARLQSWALPTRRYLALTLDLFHELRLNLAVFRRVVFFLAVLSRHNKSLKLCVCIPE